MKRVALLAPISLALIMVAGCGGGDNTTSFVLQSGSPAASSSLPAASASATASGSAAASLPGTAATPIPDDLRIIIDSPNGGSAIASPVDVAGTASVENGTVVGVVLDAAGNELGRATTMASARRPDFGHYDLSVTFSGATPGAKGQLKVFGVSPRDGKTPTNWYFINVRFS